MGKEKSLQGIEVEEKVKRCPDCGSADIVNHDEELYCKKCGLVLS